MLLGEKRNQMVVEYCGCEVVIPGSFVEGKFVVYRPSTRETEFSEV